MNKDDLNKTQTFYAGGRGEGKTRALIGYIKTQSKIIDKYKEEMSDAFDQGFIKGEAFARDDTDRSYREGVATGAEYGQATAKEYVDKLKATIAELQKEIERLKDLLHQKTIGYDKGRSDERAIQRERIITLLNTDD